MGLGFSEAGRLGLGLGLGLRLGFGWGQGCTASLSSLLDELPRADSRFLALEAAVDSFEPRPRAPGSTSPPKSTLACSAYSSLDHISATSPLNLRYISATSPLYLACSSYSSLDHIPAISPLNLR